MARSLSSILALYVLTPGRRIYTLRRVRERAEAKALEAIVAAIDEAVAQDRKALELDAARVDPPRKPPGAADKDRIVDATLTALDDMLSYRAGRSSDDIAATMQTRLFPGGVYQHTRLAHVEQSSANERVLAILEGEDDKAWLDAQGLRPLIEDLRADHDAFVAALQAIHGYTPVSWEQVKAARARGQELYAKVVFQIVAAYLDDEDGREHLLGPIWQQEELVRSFRRKRRGSLIDVDPESGELLDDDDGDASEGEDSPAADDAG